MPARASAQDGTHPRPQLLRDAWSDLSGTWQFAHDDERAGLAQRWHAQRDLADRTVFDRDITVPYPPEAPLSGVGDPGPHPVLWYRRGLRLADAGGPEAVRALRERGSRLLLRFGAVDYRARAWLDGALLGGHEGGQTPWSVDVTDVLDPAEDPGTEHVLVVRAEDDPRDVTQPRGKQDWQDVPHDIWYLRTSGIWQPVWLEVVPALAVEHLAWTPDVPGAAVGCEVTLTAAPREPVRVTVRLDLDGVVLAEQTARVGEQRARLVIGVPALENGQGEQQLLWSPDHPRLVDARVVLTSGDGGTGVAAGGEVLDDVTSYLGLRTAGAGRGAFLLNGRPCYLRSVLAQNYWPTSHLAAPSAAALRREVELVKELGFNAVRVHQKAEDPRFLHWCDRLGVLVWGETANAYAFSPEAVRRLTTEWMDLVRRDASHPSVVTWVPINESWGVQHIATHPAQQSYATGLAALTRALDPSRPVVSNDGWEHTDSDLWTVHDYAERGEALREAYGSREAVAQLLAGGEPAGRVLRLPGGAERGQPVVLTEFGGVRFMPVLGGEEPEADAEPGQAGVATWGYSTASDARDFEARLRDLLDAVRASPVLAGFCYTQLTDTLQEANGLLDAERRPKLPVEVLRDVVTGPGPRRPG
ncbi:glycoside hydrolase family 2 protein [Quadrisphaera sp. DSM 44207]|uniref:glycoside hydrolase family 2 protein n=1 Tax=Quadrisphaera sp. DSM 44207 TaxID=1881057 RepID=UPI00089156E7|nr:glycoside hydrolase family 2 TIM barrel-domain containing protein [Quadrisphaera sp. DSM 44207]SDQ34653.1 Glycosyl hydrolases family 2, TIM barrel domain [Quadrisphaera sp. DSM 44207]